ncbi:MAG TPA: DUF6458 family protein [Kineosporiaceae bacterium]|jgi:hypothetical protein|nr:DUF6458 family protein [Kineosporiaceae bacterium]
MYIGGGLTLLVVGAILAFGVRDRVDALDLTAIGWICMVVGALAIVLSLALNRQRTNTSHTEVVERRDLGGGPPPPGY